MIGELYANISTAVHFDVKCTEPNNGFKAEYLGDFSVNHFVKSEEKCRTGRQTITNRYINRK